jgi:hypothetical protein
MKIFGILGTNMSVLEAAIAFGILGGIFAAIRQIGKARQAKHLKSSLDELQKRIAELPKTATEEQFREVLKNWETGSK